MAAGTLQPGSCHDVLQGLAVAAATREAARQRGDTAKRKREGEGAGGGDAKRAAPPRVIPVISHEVAVPKDFDEAARGLDPKLHGALPAQTDAAHRVLLAPAAWPRRMLQSGCA